MRSATARSAWGRPSAPRPWLDAATDCAAKDRFDCARAGLAKAAALAAGTADQGRVAAARAAVQREADRHAEDLRRAEEERARQAELARRAEEVRQAELARQEEERRQFEAELARQEEERQAARRLAAQQQERRAKMQSQLEAARACADKGQFDCAVTNYNNALAFIQDSADQQRCGQYRDYIAKLSEKATQDQARLAASSGGGSSGGSAGYSSVGSTGLSSSVKAPSYTAPTPSPPRQTYHSDGAGVNRIFQQVIRDYSRNGR